MGIIIALYFGINAGYAQKVKEADVPAAVKEAFAKKYPGLKAEWEKEGENYEAEYDGKMLVSNSGSEKPTKKEMEGSVLIGPDGSILETEEEINVKALPAGVTDHITTNMKGSKIKEAYKITDAKGAVTYETEIGKDEYLFDSKGTFIKKLDKKDEKDEKDEKSEKDEKDDDD